MYIDFPAESSGSDPDAAVPAVLEASPPFPSQGVTSTNSKKHCKAVISLRFKT